MGIKSNYTKQIKKLLSHPPEEIFKKVHISLFSYKKVAIDTSLFLYKYKVSMQKKWLLGFLNMICIFRKYCIHCVFIFDGILPLEKQQEQQDRKNRKKQQLINVSILEKDLEKYENNNIISERLRKISKTINITHIKQYINNKKNQIVDVSDLDFNNIKKMLDICNIPYYTSSTEAEKLCSKLCIDNLVDAVLSDDTDILAYKCPVSLSKFNIYDETVVCVEIKQLISSLKLSEEQFLEHCILCGTDYNKNIYKMGLINSYKNIKKYKKIETIANILKIDITPLNLNVVRKLFTVFDDHNIKYIPYCGYPDFQKLQKFLIKNNIHIKSEYIKYFSNKNLLFN